MCNKQKKKKKNFFLFPFFSSFVDIGRRSNNAKRLIVLIGYISLSFLLLLLLSVEKRKRPVTVTYRRQRKREGTYIQFANQRREWEEETSNTTIINTKERETDRRLAGASDSFSFFFSSVRSFLCCCRCSCTTFWRVSFFLFLLLLFSSLSLSRLFVSTSFFLSIAYTHDYYQFRWFSRLFLLKRERRRRKLSKNWKSSTSKFTLLKISFLSIHPLISMDEWRIHQQQQQQQK